MFIVHHMEMKLNLVRNVSAFGVVFELNVLTTFGLDIIILISKRFQAAIPNSLEKTKIHNLKILTCINDNVESSNCFPDAMNGN